MPLRIGGEDLRSSWSWSFASGSVYDRRYRGQLTRQALGHGSVSLFVGNSLNDCVMRLVRSHGESKGGDSTNRKPGNAVQTVEIQNDNALFRGTVETDGKPGLVRS